MNVEYAIEKNCKLICEGLHSIFISNLFSTYLYDVSKIKMMKLNLQKPFKVYRYHQIQSSIRTHKQNFTTIQLKGDNSKQTLKIKVIPRLEH